MSINTIAAASSLNYWQQQEHARTDYNLHSAAGTFGQILAKLTAAQNETGAEAESGVAPVTLTELLSDGSLVILKVEGNQVISEAKLDGTSVLEQQLLRGYAAPLADGTAADAGIDATA